MTSLFDDLLTEEQILFRDSVRGFAERHLADGRLARAHERSFSFDVARLMARPGALGLTFPAADGGAGGSLMQAIQAIEAVGADCLRSAAAVPDGKFGSARGMIGIECVWRG